MIEIKLTRTIKAKDFIKELEEKYGTVENLKKIVKATEDVKLQLDAEDWEYFKDKPDEDIHDSILIFDEKPAFTTNDLEIINLIKNEKPKSVSELANLMEKDVSNITKQVNKLKEKGIVELQEGNINNMKTPVFNYDKIEIAI